MVWLAGASRFGCRGLVDLINSWWDEWHHNDWFLHTTYEGLTGSAEKELMRIIAHFEEPSSDTNLVAKVAEFSSFWNMKRLKKDGVIPDIILQRGDVGDPESYKVRRGVIGGIQITCRNRISRLLKMP